VRDMAKAAAPAVKLLLDLIAAPAPKGSSLKDIVGGQKKSGQLGEGGRRVELPPGVFSRVGPAANDSVSQSLDFSPLFDETSGKSAIIGDASVEGMANAIRNNPDAISAMAEMAGAVLMQARQTLQVQSPSKAMAEIGDYTAQGFAVGAEGSDAPAKAGKAIAEGAMGGAAGGAVGGAGAAGPAGGGAEGPVTINVIVPPGSSAETQAAAKRGSEEGLREWQAYKRRDAREAA